MPRPRKEASIDGVPIPKHLVTLDNCWTSISLVFLTEILHPLPPPIPLMLCPAVIDELAVAVADVAVAVMLDMFISVDMDEDICSIICQALTGVENVDSAAAVRYRSPRLGESTRSSSRKTRSLYQHSVKDGVGAFVLPSASICTKVSKIPEMGHTFKLILPNTFATAMVATRELRVFAVTSHRTVIRPSATDVLNAAGRVHKQNLLRIHTENMLTGLGKPSVLHMATRALVCPIT